MSDSPKKYGVKRVLPSGEAVMVGKAIHYKELMFLVEARKEWLKQPEATWDELHLRYLNWKGGRDYPWLTGNFIPRIANRDNCQCRVNFHQYVVTHFIDWNDPFAFTVAVHNDVNTRRGVATLTVDEARAFWSQRALPAG